MRFHNLITGAALTSVSALATHADPGDGNFYLFGDSGLSMGNLYITYPHFTGDPRYSRDGLIHRESNGWVWPEYMLNGDVRTSLDPTATSRNWNFSFSGANSGLLGVGIFPDGTEDYFAPTGVHVQLDMFDAMRQSTGLTISPDDVFFVGAGANDYFNRGAFVPLEQITADLVADTATSVERLVETGAKYIFVEPVPDFDIAPQFIELDPTTRGLVRDMTATARDLQANRIAALQKTLPDDVTIVSLRIDGAVYYMQDKALELGFTNLSDPCIAPDASICSDDLDAQNQYIFWDHLHLTTKAQKVQARYYQAFMDAGFGTAGRYASRLPDVGLQMLKGYGDGNFARVSRGVADGISMFMDTRLAAGKLESDGQDITTDFDFQRYGGGFEFALTDQNRVGATFHYLTGDIDIGYGTPIAAYAKPNAYIAGFYGRLEQSSFSLQTGFQYAWLKYKDFQRETAATAIVGRAETEGTAWRFDARAGYRLLDGPLRAEPYVTFHWAESKVDAFQEAAEGMHGLALSYKEQKAVTKAAGVGLRASFQPQTDGFQISPWVDVRYERLLDGKSRDVTYQIMDNWARPITFTTDKPDKDLMRLEGGVSMAVTRNIDLNISYSTEVMSRDKLDQNIHVSLGFQF